MYNGYLREWKKMTINYRWNWIYRNRAGTYACGGWWRSRSFLILLLTVIVSRVLRIR